MISIGFVNGLEKTPYILDPYNTFEECVYDTLQYIEDMYTSLDVLFKECEMKEFMEDTSEETNKEKENASKSVIDKVGQKVIDLCNKAIEFIKSIFNKFKEATFKNKSTVDKLEMLVKDHPDLKDQIILSYQAGDLKIADVKSIQELDKAFNEVMAMDDPNSIKTKWKRAKAKFTENADFFKAIGLATAAVTGIVTIGYVITKYRGDAAKSAMTIEERKQAAIDAKDKIASTMKNVTKEDVFKAKAQVNVEYNNCNSAWASKIQKFYGSIITKAGDFVQKHASDASKEAALKQFNAAASRGAELKAKENLADEKLKLDADKVKAEIDNIKTQWDINKKKLSEIEANETDDKRGLEITQLKKNITLLGEKIKEAQEKEDLDDARREINALKNQLKDANKRTDELLAAIGKAGKKK